MWPSDAIWRHRSGSTLAQVMACCLTAPSHYLNQCWLIISKVHWHSSEGNFAKDTSATNHFKITPAGSTSAVLEWQHKPWHHRPYEWSISILPRKRSNTVRWVQRRSWRWAAMLKRPGWQRHCDDKSIHRNSVRIIDQCDITIASSSLIDDATIAQLLTFEIISGVARNNGMMTTWRLNYKWAVVFFNGEYHQRLNSCPWWQFLQQKESAEPWIVW